MGEHASQEAVFPPVDSLGAQRPSLQGKPLMRGVTRSNRRSGRTPLGSFHPIRR
jgi:hypothetical protein